MTLPLGGLDLRTLSGAVSGSTTCMTQTRQGGQSIVVDVVGVAVEETRLVDRVGVGHGYKESAFG